MNLHLVIDFGLFIAAISFVLSLRAKGNASKNLRVRMNPRFIIDKNSFSYLH